MHLHVVLPIKIEQSMDHGNGTLKQKKQGTLKILQGSGLFYLLISPV